MKSAWFVTTLLVLLASYTANAANSLQGLLKEIYQKKALAGQSYQAGRQRRDPSADATYARDMKTIEMEYQREKARLEYAGNPFAQLTASSQQAPYGTQRAPYGTQRAPYGSQQAPYGSQQTPYGSQRAPYGSQQTPYGSQQTPSGSQQAPYGSQQPYAQAKPQTTNWNQESYSQPQLLPQTSVPPSGSAGGQGQIQIQYPPVGRQIVPQNGQQRQIQPQTMASNMTSYQAYSVTTQKPPSVNYGSPVAQRKPKRQSLLPLTYTPFGKTKSTAPVGQYPIRTNHTAPPPYRPPPTGTVHQNHQNHYQAPQPIAPIRQDASGINPSYHYPPLSARPPPPPKTAAFSQPVTNNSHANDDFWESFGLAKPVPASTEPKIVKSDMTTAQKAIIERVIGKWVNLVSFGELDSILVKKLEQEEPRGESEKGAFFGNFVVKCLKRPAGTQVNLWLNKQPHSDIGKFAVVDAQQGSEKVDIRVLYTPINVEQVADPPRPSKASSGGSGYEFAQPRSRGSGRGYSYRPTPFVRSGTSHHFYK